MRLMLIVVCCFTFFCSCDLLYDVMNEQGSGDPTESEVAQALRQALEQGADEGTEELSAFNGYFGNPKIKIPFPPEAKQVETTLRTLGMNELCDDVIESVNRAAEKAAAEAKPILVNAIKAMTIADAFDILFGSDSAATHYLRLKTTSDIKSKFKPVIQSSLDKVNATKYWEEVITVYNNLPLVQDVNPDLAEFVTLKAMDGLFLKLAEEEKRIRENPLERLTALLQKVFAYYDRNKNK
jgi:hypothetical protein